jgi:hypothetical protein
LFAVSISVCIHVKQTVPVCFVLEESKRDCARRTVNGEPRTVNAGGKRLRLLLKWGHQQLILPRGLFGLFP